MNSCRFLLPSLARARPVMTTVLFAGIAAMVAPAQVYYPPVRETANHGPSLGPNSARPISNLSNISAMDSTRVIQRPFDPFFLPALLPVLGDARPANRELLAEGYPRESAGEPYFMAEGNLAAQNLLSAKRAENIASYRTARLTLLTELRAELERGPEVSAAVRARALADLAAAQTPRLLELESEAEQIRHDLTHVELLKVTADDIGKLVPIDEDPKLKERLAALRLILSAAHFRDGFSPDQRRLLEEMAQELRLTLEPRLAASRSVFFWPAGARIPTPTGLTPGMAEKFEEFQRRKAALKDDLRAALERERNQVFNFDHTEDFVQLAAAQAPRFAELDALADQLRPALAALTDAGDTLATHLPDDLARQVAALAERTSTLQREMYAQLAEFRHALPDDRLELTRQGTGLAIIVTTNKDTPSNRDLVLARINDFNEELSGRFTALATVRDRVRDALARYQATAPNAKPGMTVDRFAADFLAAQRAREYRNRQRDYATAVLAPGLSPAQRRLLLAAATADSVQENPSPAPPPIAASLH